MEHRGSWNPIKMGWVHGQPESAVHVRHTIGVVVWYQRRRDPGDSRAAGLAYIHTIPKVHTYMMHMLEGLALSTYMQMIWDGRLEGHANKREWERRGRKTKETRDGWRRIPELLMERKHYQIPEANESVGDREK